MHVYVFDNRASYGALVWRTIRRKRQNYEDDDDDEPGGVKRARGSELVGGDSDLPNGDIITGSTLAIRAHSFSSIS